MLESVSVTAEKALDQNVIDLIAKDLPDLLEQIDGREVKGEKLSTAKAKVVEIPMTPREKFLHFVLRPEVMFVLMLMVIYGIIGELSSPGAILPGVAGATAVSLRERGERWTRRARAARAMTSAGAGTRCGGRSDLRASSGSTCTPLDAGKT